MEQVKVLVNDAINQKLVEILKSSGMQVECQKLKPDELAQQVGNYDCLVVRSATKVTKPILEAAAANKKLRLIGRAGVGVDNIDVEQASA